jgi:hypothetical protein
MLVVRDSATQNAATVVSKTQNNIAHKEKMCSFPPSLLKYL